jgi:quercetin 2,3-dioxygenase
LARITSTFPFPGQRDRLKVEAARSAFADVFADSGAFPDSSELRAALTEQVAKPDAPPVCDVSNHSLVLFESSDEITVWAGDDGINFSLVSGKSIMQAERAAGSVSPPRANPCP